MTSGGAGDEGIVSLVLNSAPKDTEEKKEDE